MGTRPPDRPGAVDLERGPRRVRVLPAGVGVLVVGAAAALAALVSGRPALWVLALALGGAVASDLLVARAALAHVRPEVSGPAQARVGEPVAHVVLLTGLTQPVVVERPPGWGQSRLTLAVRSAGPVTALLDTPTRGLHPDLVLDLVAPGPLGLADAARRVRPRRAAPLAVAPPPVAHDPAWPRPRTFASDESAPTARGDALHRGVRPYRRGDPRRWVHWPATAHHGALMVKELDGLEHVALRVVLDLTAPGPHADLAVGRAAWLVEQALARGWQVHLVTAEGPVTPAPPLGRPRWPVVPRPPVPATRTVTRRIDRPAAAVAQLAAAAHGPPVIDRWSGTTRLVTPGGDQWL